MGCLPVTVDPLLDGYSFAEACEILMLDESQGDVLVRANVLTPSCRLRRQMPSSPMLFNTFDMLRCVVLVSMIQAPGTEKLTLEDFEELLDFFVESTEEMAETEGVPSSYPLQSKIASRQIHRDDSLLYGELIFLMCCNSCWTWLLIRVEEFNTSARMFH